MSTLAISTPSSIKWIKGLIIFRALLVLVFFAVFTVKGITIGTIGPQIILYTFFAFAAFAILHFYLLRKRQLMPFRIALVLDLLAALPASAFISIVLSVVILGLTFTKSAKAYFE